MGPLPVLLMLGVTAVVVLGSIGLVIVIDPAARLARYRFDRIVRRDAARLIDELDRYRSTSIR